MIALLVAVDVMLAVASVGAWWFVIFRSFKLKRDWEDLGLELERLNRKGSSRT